jgi:hypothetical protein
MQTPRAEQVFAVMADGGYATSTIDHAWTYLNQALLGDHPPSHSSLAIENASSPSFLPRSRA